MRPTIRLHPLLSNRRRYSENEVQEHCSVALTCLKHSLLVHFHNELACLFHSFKSSIYPFLGNYIKKRVWKLLALNIFSLYVRMQIQKYRCWVVDNNAPFTA